MQWRSRTRQDSGSSVLKQGCAESELMTIVALVED
jgi:hypothetical protein